MSRLLTVPSGATAKWVIFATWVAIAFGAIGFGLVSKFSEAENNESTSFLPSDAESTRALAVVEQLQQGEQAAIIIVYRREGGLTRADQQRISEDVRELNAAREQDRDTYRAVAPFRPPGQGTQTRDAALVVSSIVGDGESDTILDPIADVRERVSDPDGDLAIAVTGPAGFAADAIEVFEGINGTLLGAAFGLVIVLLILIYRSPFFWIIPIFAVAVAEITTRGLGYLITELGATVNGQSSSILSVLVLGTGTDYALLLVARYREELRRHPNKHDAMAQALRTAGPAIVASGCTVIAALLCLSIAEVDGTAGLGPIGALGVFVAMTTMLTLLPALLVVCGRWVFWHPKIFGGHNGIPRFGEGGRTEEQGVWRRVGDRVARRPRRVWVVTALVLAAMFAGMATLDTGLTQTEAFREEVESIQGQEILARSFPAGANAPTDVVLPDASRAQAVAAAVREVDGVAAVAPNPQGGQSGRLLAVTLEPQPYSTEAFDLVPEIREAAKAAGGEDVLVGGASAIEYDVRQAAQRDSTVIIPIALAVVFLILIGLLRALVAPLLLIATVVLSFGAALGFSLIVFDVVFGFAGIDPSLPLFAFIFLVALGIDYNIFLMARVREETLQHGTREGMLRGLAVTGGVITSAGIVLAGTFAVLALLPLVFLTEIGFAIAFGVLLDTFIVRSVLVPALVLDAGPKVWWPSRLARAETPDKERPGAVPAG
jgi:RND superfamily putative drug exporter